MSRAALVSPLSAGSRSRSRTLSTRGGAVECSVRGDRATGCSEKRRSRNTESDLDNREVIYKWDRKSGKKRVRINRATSKAIHFRGPRGTMYIRRLQ